MMSSPILNQPVFYDPAGRRHRRARGTTLALAALVVALVVILIASAGSPIRGCPDWICNLSPNGPMPPSPDR